MVADLTIEEVEEIYFVRAELEKIAARLVLENITRAEIQNLKGLSREVEKHLREKTHQVIEKDSEFHQAIFSASRNKYLCDIIDYLRTKAHIVRFNAWSLPHRIEESISEHSQMIRAIEKRDLKGLERLVVQHLTFSKNSYLTQLKGMTGR
jgi:DNA-binding GntR family transcriptional regulator